MGRQPRVPIHLRSMAAATLFQLASQLAIFYPPLKQTQALWAVEASKPRLILPIGETMKKIPVLGWISKCLHLVPVLKCSMQFVGKLATEVWLG